jgi:hypothetical protein
MAARTEGMAATLEAAALVLSDRMAGSPRISGVRALAAAVAAF